MTAKITPRRASPHRSEQLEPGICIADALASQAEASVKDGVRSTGANRQRSGQPGLLLLRGQRAARSRAALAALCSLSLALGSMVSRVAHAQPLDTVSREAATSLAVAGLEAYEAGQYAEALSKLEKAYAVARVPTLGLWSARSLYKLGRWREAEDRYRETVGLALPEGDQDTQQQALADAQTELAALSPTIPSLIVEIEGARLSEVELRIDGKPAPNTEPSYRLDPGAHHVEAFRGPERQSADLTLAARETRTLLLHFSPDLVSPAIAGAGVAAPGAAAAPISSTPGEKGNHWLRPAGWTALALGGVGIAVGALGTVLAIGKKSDIDENANCQGNACAPSEQDLVDSYNSNRHLANFGFIAGGVLAAAGVGALVISGRSSADPRAEAVFSPAFTGVRGSF
jgi:tetratricopeptide (TPR) repeat protein